MAGLDRHINPCIPELFEIASKNMELAKRIYELSKNEFWIFEEIKPYLESKENNVLSLSAMIAMDNFENELSIKNLIDIQQSSDSLIRAGARVIALSRKLENKDYSYLSNVETFSSCRESADLSRYLLLSNFEGQMSIEIVLKFQESSDEDVRNMSREKLLKMQSCNFTYKTLEKYINNKDNHVSSLAAELLMLKLPEQISWNTLIDLQISSSINIRKMARSLVFEIPKDRIQKERLMSYLDAKNSNVRDLAMELILKHFDFLLTGKEILEIQKSQNAILRGLGKDVALSLPASRWIGDAGNAIKKAMSSHHFGMRRLAVELNNKFNYKEELDKEAMNFLARYGF